MTSNSMNDNKDSSSRKPFNALEGCAWPDPDPSLADDATTPSFEVNDVSQLSATRVHRIVFPRSEQDVVQVLQQAQKKHVFPMSIRGTQHSMGGHCMANDGVIIDTAYLNDMEYNANQEHKDTITVGPGCQWKHVIQLLNKHAKSPKVMQSYCTFSVGGTLAVNAHGITSDETLASCVESFRLVRYNSATNDVEVTTCTRPKEENSQKLSESEELFGLALGGYGLFGVITQVTLDVADNVDLEMESLTALSLRSNNDEACCEFVRVWDACRADKDTVDIKLARLDVLTLDTATLYVFRKGYGRTISDLSMQPRQLSSWGRLLYKWALPLLKDVRYSREESLGQALDMQNQNMTRNDVLWESALPLAKLYSPLVVLDDTFVLQEFFVPHDCFGKWIEAARPIFKDIDDYQRNGRKDKEVEVPAQSLTLLNTTIRYVEQDTSTFLKYSSREGGMFAFVLYFRIKRTPEVEHDLGVFHNRLAEAAVALGGTFYLPYRKCYDKDLFLRAYPQLEAFAAMKEKYDPLCLFSSEWFDHYVLPLCSSAYQATFNAVKCDSSSRFLSSSENSTVVTEAQFMLWLPRINDPLLDRRTNSYRTLLKDKYLRKRFSEEFLINVFNIADPSEVMRVMTKAAWDPRNADDLAIYKVLREHFHGSTPTKPVAALQQGWRALRQLSHQKTELSHETAIILHRLGKFGHIRRYLSVGDHGKTVRNFRKIGLLDPCGETQVIVAHDFHPEEDEVSIHAVLERGSIHPVGDKQIQFDYLNDDAELAFKEVPSASMDLVTLNQGLHHFPQQKLYGFLCEVRRILCQGGVFIFREHDLDLQRSASTLATSAPVAMLDLAHSVFNAVTGVSEHEEANEIRAFRPLSEWRSMLEKIGLDDSMLYGFEEGDCTCDFMLCFSNGEVSAGLAHPCPSPSMPPPRLESTIGDQEPPMMATIRALLAQVPAAVAGTAERLVEKLLQMLPAFLENLSKFLLVEVPKAVIDDANKHRSSGSDDSVHRVLLNADSITEFATLVENFLRNKLERIIDIGTGTKDLLRDINIRETSNIAGLLTMPELFLVLPLLKRKMTLHPERVGEVEKMFLEFVENAFPMLLQFGDSRTEHPVSASVTTATTAVSEESSDQPPALSDEQTISPDGPVDTNDVLQVIITLSQEIPGLLDPSIVLAKSGFTLSQQSALVGSLAAQDLPAFAENVAWYHDQQTWQQLRWLLVGDSSGTVQVESVATSRDLPTKELLFSKELNHPWRCALKAFFRGPRVILKQQALFGLRVLDLGELVALYKEAKDEASRNETGTTLNRNAGLSHSETNTLNHYVSRLSGMGQVKEARIQFNGPNTYDLYDVAEVIKAEFGYKSLTSSLTDVTNEMRALHADVHARKDSNTVPGWLPIREDLLTRFRNKGGAAKVGDSLRKVVVGTGSLGLAGNNVLKLAYLPLQTTGLSPDEVKVADELCAYTEQRCLINAGLHPNDGHYTWFKLSEWMQVEMMELFTKSLDHTPWYQFPFFDYLSTYFRILFQECEIVRFEHGLLQAYGSMAFATDFVPGIIMSFLFAQMKLLSVPLKLSLPTYDPNIMTEEILLTACLPNMKSNESVLHFFKSVVDERIRDASFLCTPNDTLNTGLYRIMVPTFKQMGEILIIVGERLPSARILQISNQKVVQVALECSADSVEWLAREINSMEGLYVMFHYQYPQEASLIRLSLKVKVTSLLVLTRFVARLESIEVKQIYDFWSG